MVAGAKEVVLLDREPLSLQCALMNAQLNRIPLHLDSTSSNSGSGTCCSKDVQPSSLHQLAQQLSLQAQPAGGAGSRAAVASAGLSAGRTRAQQGLAPTCNSTSSSTTSSTNGGSKRNSNNSSTDSGTKTSDSSSGALYSRGVVRAEVFDWAQPQAQPRFDVALACDVLYEAFSVEVRHAGRRGGKGTNKVLYW